MSRPQSHTLSTAQALALLLLLTLLAVGAAGTAVAQPTVPDGDPETIDRLAEADPAAFAVAVSQQRWADGAATHAVVVTGNAFADALAASSLAGRGPLLYADDVDLLIAEISRTTPRGRQVFLIGGEAAIGADVEQAVRDAGYSPTRLQGLSRFETAASVAVRTAGTGAGGTVFVAVGSNWVDSIAIAPWLSANNAPLVLTPTDSLHPAAEQAIRTIGPDRILVLGGTAAISDEVVDALSRLASAGGRIAGATRDTTAAAIVRLVWGGTASGTYTLTNLFLEDGWRYGLAGAPLAGDLRAPLLSVHPDVDLASTADIVCRASGDLLVLGPEAQVSDDRAQATRTCP